jgi:hypothetical protein
MSRVMNNNSKRSFLREVLFSMSNAVAAASAVERGARPLDEDLRRLGIDPEAFRRIKRFY